MKQWLVIILVSFFAGASFGQTPKIDSLKHLVQNANGKSSRLDAILNLCAEFETLPVDTLWNYAIKARSLASSINDPVRRSKAIWAQAQAYLRWDNADSARALIEPELARYKVEEPGTRDLYFKFAQLKIDCVGTDNNYREAIAEIYNVMRQAEKYKDSVVLAEDMNTLGAFSYDMNFVAKGREWGFKGLRYTSNTPRFNSVLTGLYINLADNYRWVWKLDSATYFVHKAMDLSSKAQNLLYLSRAYEIEADIYVRQKKYADAEAAMLQSIRIIKKVDGDVPQQDEVLALAAVYRSSGQFDKAISVLNSGLIADSIYQKISPHAKHGADVKDLQMIFYNQELARSYRLKGDTKNYSVYLEKVIAGKDAFYNTNSAQAIAELETKYQLKTKEATIARQNLALIQENYLFYGSILFVTLGGVIIGLLFKDYKRKQSIKLTHIQEEEKRLSARAILIAQEKDRKRIAADLHDNLGAQLSYIMRNVNFIMDQPAGLNKADELQYLGNVNDVAQSAMIDLRETIWVLNKDQVYIQEFADKLKSYLKQQLLNKAMIKWNFNENITGAWKLSAGEVMHIFRIVQEVISNIIKHSDANLTTINLESTRQGIYELAIMDNGKGFNAENEYFEHYGLENIRNRAKEISCELLIKSDLQSGTRIVLKKYAEAVLQ